jgi:type VI secretion system secreted protein Hcp
MADIYMQIDGIKGESTDSQHKDWIELLDFNHGIVQPASATASSAGGGTTAQCQHRDYTITKYVDLASPKLYEICSSGKHLKDVTIEMLRSSGDSRVKYMVVKMEQVVISQVAPSGGADFPIESVSFNYGTIKWTYTQQKRNDGSGGGNMAAGWSLVEHKTAG